MKQALTLRWAKEKTTREIAEMQRQLDAVTQDQTRIRANLKETPSTSKLHKIYLDKLELQESQIETYQADIKKLQGVEHSQKKEFDDFLASFSAD